MRHLAGARRRHEVLHLPHPVGHQEARDEDVGVGEVELLGAPAVAVGRDAEQPPAVGVEDRREHARRVEARAAVPVDRPVGAHERDGVQVADQAMLGDRQVARPRCPENSSGRDLLDQVLRVICERPRAYGTSTSFPSTPSSRASRARAAPQRAASVRRPPGGSCPRAAARPASRSPHGTTPGSAARRQRLRLAMGASRNSGPDTRAPAGGATAWPRARRSEPPHTTR